MLSEGRFRAALAVLLVAAFLVRLGAAIWWDARLPAPQSFGLPDSESYWELGRQLARGGPYEFQSPERRVFRAPGYPLLLAALFSMRSDASVFSARVLGALLGSATVAITVWWAARLFDRSTALFAGLLSTFYPGGIALSVFILSEALFCPLMLLELALWTSALTAQRVAVSLTAAAAAGGIGAAAALTRPSWLLFTPLAAVLGAVLYRRPREILISAIVLLALVIAMAPWWIRNATVTGHFVPTTLQVGVSLADGLNSRADGSSNLAPVGELEARERRRLLGEQLGPGEIEYRLDQYLRRTALDWAAANPRAALRLAAIKVSRMWNIWPNEPMFRSLPLRLTVMASYVPILVLGLLGAWQFRFLGFPVVLAWLPAVYFTLVHAVFVGSIRYREPAMLALMVLAAAELVRLSQKRFRPIGAQTRPA